MCSLEALEGKLRPTLSELSINTFKYHYVLRKHAVKTPFCWAPHLTNVLGLSPADAPMPCKGMVLSASHILSWELWTCGGIIFPEPLLLAVLHVSMNRWWSVPGESHRPWPIPGSCALTSPESPSISCAGLTASSTNTDVTYIQAVKLFM